MLAYAPDSLRVLDWQSSGGIPALERPLGYDLDERIAYLLDVRHRLIGLDLESGRGRPYLTGVRAATVGPEGAVYVVDSLGRVLRMLRRLTTTFPARYPKPPVRMFGAINGQLLAVRPDSEATVQLLTTDRSGAATPVGDGPIAATFWGELLAVGTSSGIRLIRTSDGAPVRTIRLSDPPDALTFSPAGHRLYALVQDVVQVFDRFSGDRRASIDLPGAARELRLDASGRWMLARPVTGDSAWVIDLATERMAASVPTGWRSDLPLVAGAATLLTLAGDHVDAFDLSMAPPRAVAHVINGGTDLWMALPWVPPQRAILAIAAAESASATQDSGLVADTATSTGPELWLQISSSQNPDWADDLARQLAELGHPATVWKPGTPEEGYRVVVGPYRTREAAEAAGRRLDRPYFVVSAAPKQP